MKIKGERSERDPRKRQGETNWRNLEGALLDIRKMGREKDIMRTNRYDRILMKSQEKDEI